MPMQRETLKQYLRAGPSRRFDVSSFTRRLGPSAPADQMLFSTAFLNATILFKCVDLDSLRRSDDGRMVNTLIYMPYDVDKPGDGGESVIFCEENFLRLCEYKLTCGDIDGRLLIADAEKLKILDSVPTFSPFIVELAFERAEIPIPQSYLELSPEIRNKVTQHLKGRLRPLIIAAYKQASMNIERAVEDLTAKLFCLRDIREILPLVNALRLPPEMAQDVLKSWIGIAYFEYEYATLQPKLKEFAQWVARHGDSGEQMIRQDREYVRSLASAIRQRIQQEWNAVVGISAAYRESYDAMVFRGHLEPFVAFLQGAQVSYWQMGDVLGKLEQGMLVWKHFTRTFQDGRLPPALLLELLAVLRDLLITAPSVAAWGGDPAPAVPMLNCNLS
jgi:hypothetical protein